MIWTSFLFSSIIFILSKIGKKNFGGKKFTSLLLFDPLKIAKMAKNAKCANQICFPAVKLL